MTMLKADIKKWIEATKLFESKDFEGCISVLQSANESSKVCYTLGMSYFNAGKASDALYYFAKSTEYDTFLAIGYYMRGVCSIKTKDHDGAYWDFSGALEKMREHDYIDYTQLKMPYRLLRSEILFNLSLSLVLGGRDAREFLDEARKCSEVHDELKSQFDAGIQKMYNGQANGINPLIADVTKIFHPPKVSSEGGGGMKVKPAPIGSPMTSPGPSSPLMSPSTNRSPLPSPQRSLPSAPLPPPSNQAPRTAPVPGSARPSPSPVQSPPMYSFRPPMNSLPPVPSPSPGSRPSPTPGRSNAVRANGAVPLPTPAQVEMLRFKVYYKDKRLVEIPKDAPDFYDLKSRIEKKFVSANLLIKYVWEGTATPINTQDDLILALSGSITELYVNKPGEVNTFEPKPAVPEPSKPAQTSGSSDWMECYTDEGDLYYFNKATGESSWEPPKVTAPKQVSVPRSGSGGGSGNSSPRGITSSQHAVSRSGSGGGSPGSSPRGQVAVPGRAPQKLAPVSDWIECFTDDGDKYYYNTRTDESSWEPRT